jgi:filamentous hemagglutinin family protein
VTRVRQIPQRRARFALVALASLAVPATSARAQVVLDGTLGPSGPRIGPNYIVPMSVGRLVGTNLFHSFAQFNVNQGESVTFTAPSAATVSNVLARVTGGQPSNINGLLRSAVPGANFYLIRRGVRTGGAARRRRLVRRHDRRPDAPRRRRPV